MCFPWILIMQYRCSFGCVLKHCLKCRFSSIYVFIWNIKVWTFCTFKVQLNWKSSEHKHRYTHYLFHVVSCLLVALYQVCTCRIWVESLSHDAFQTPFCMTMQYWTEFTQRYCEFNLQYVMEGKKILSEDYKKNIQAVSELKSSLLFNVGSELLCSFKYVVETFHKCSRKICSKCYKSCWSLNLFILFPIHVGEIVLETSTLLYIFDTKNVSDYNMFFFLLVNIKSTSYMDIFVYEWCWATGMFSFSSLLVLCVDMTWLI